MCVNSCRRKLRSAAEQNHFYQHRKRSFSCFSFPSLQLPYSDFLSQCPSHSILEFLNNNTHTSQHRRKGRSTMEFDLEDPLATFKEHQNKTISELFASESDHMPQPKCLTSTHFDTSLRCEAISLILQVKVLSI